MGETTKTILLADDSVTIQKVVELTFMDENFRVTSVSNGAEAIARLGESTPDVVITDVHMPGADGYEVCRRSKELHPRVPVLLLVGTFETFDSESAARCGADGHLKKPFDSQDLLRRVRELASSGSVASPTPLAVPTPSAPEFAAPAFASPTFADPAPFETEAPGWGSVPELPAELPYDELLPLEPVESFAPSAPETRFSLRETAAAESAALPSFDFDLPQQREAPLAEPAAGTMETIGAPQAAGGPLSDLDVDRIARRMIELLGDKPIRDVAWEVVPDLAEVLLKSRIRELEASVE